MGADEPTGGVGSGSAADTGAGTGIDASQGAGPGLDASGPAPDASGSALDAEATITALGLQPHPEGGWYAETWRHSTEDGGRGHGTAIYFLLREGEESHWHAVDADEIWHHHSGGPLDLLVADTVEGPVRRTRLGPDLAAGHRPQGHVPPHAWQAARPVDGAVLVSCTVSPAFHPDGFVLAPPGWEPGPGAVDPREQPSGPGPRWSG